MLIFVVIMVMCSLLFIFGLREVLIIIVVLLEVNVWMVLFIVLNLFRCRLKFVVMLISMLCVLDRLIFFSSGEEIVILVVFFVWFLLFVMLEFIIV